MKEQLILSSLGIIASLVICVMYFYRRPSIVESYTNPFATMMDPMHLIFPAHGMPFPGMPLVPCTTPPPAKRRMPKNNDIEVVLIEDRQKCNGGGAGD